MKRKTRKTPWLQQCCYHVSHSCYGAAQIFRFAHMRKMAAERLRQLKDRFPVRILDYLLHPDGHRVLIEAEHPGHIAQAMRSFHLGTTHDYCRRKDWEGPVWRRHADITLVEKGPQALRCALEMDFAMVRTGDPRLFHPLLWKHSGHMELSGVRKRYRITDRKAIQRCFMDVPFETFREWYITASNSRWNTGEFAEEPWWNTALIVGSRELCETVADAFPKSWLELKVYPALQTVEGLGKTMSWTVTMSRKRRQEYIRSLVPPK